MDTNKLNQIEVKLRRFYLGILDEMKTPLKQISEYKALSFTIVIIGIGGGVIIGLIQSYLS